MLRRAGEKDLSFLVELDLGHEDYTPSDDGTSTDLVAHRAKIKSFVVDQNKAAWVFVDGSTYAGGILCAFRDLDTEKDTEREWGFYNEIRGFLPADGRFCEVFNLWVVPDFRRKGLATQLKQQLAKATIGR